MSELGAVSDSKRDSLAVGSCTAGAHPIGIEHPHVSHSNEGKKMPYHTN
jgi:hypothetical protein